LEATGLIVTKGAHGIRVGVWLILAVLSALTISCGGGNGSGLSGSIEIDGSSTVFPISAAVAEEFARIHHDVLMNVAVSGTGGGFQRFVVGDIDIANASRAIKPSEVQEAEAEGVEFYEMQVGTDGLTVAVNPANDWADCLTLEELVAIWKPGSEIDTWNEIRPEFPNEPLRLYGPDPDSGTFDFFTEVVMGEAQVSRSDYTASADDNVLIQGVSGDRYSLGYFGFAYYMENQDAVKALANDSGEGCIEPTPETIADGSYEPLSRPLFIYVRKASLERPEMREFIRFYMEHAAELTAEVGYIPADPSVYQDNLEKAGLADTDAPLTPSDDSVT
jgi:phosphate transport system substrate-binding protein